MKKFACKIWKKILSLQLASALVNCTMAYLSILHRKDLKLYGIFGFKFCKYTSSSSKDLFEVLEEKIEEDIGYDQWITNTKELLKNSKGRFWLGKSTVKVHFCISN